MLKDAPMISFIIVLYNILLVTMGLLPTVSLILNFMTISAMNWKNGTNGNCLIAQVNLS